MPRLRKVILTVEVETVLTLKELRKLNYLGFDSDPDVAIRDLPCPPGESNWRGRIAQVQANQIAGPVKAR
jgi:hypothetical protein